MIAKTREVIKKLEFGILEFSVGALMVIGLIGYFGTVPADMEWIDHTVSFILFSYIFYKLNITSILFGKTSRLANLIIIISYFSLVFKDIITYTSVNAYKFNVIKFVDYFYLFFSNNLFLTNLATFYIGILGIFVISIYLTKKIELSHPSFLYALYQKRIKNNLIKFLSIFISLLGFYYFVYNIILEWLEFTIDDPVVATGVVFYITLIVKHHQKFHSENFIFKIGDFSSKWYLRLISLFHYKKTLPLAISGLLILHALSDLGVFAYSLIFLKENFYLEFLRYEHSPFLRLFLGDAKNVPSFALMPLLVVYILNALSLGIFLLIPVIVWVRMFSQKEMHFGRIFVFFIYSSAIAYALLPAYIIQPISQLSVKGALVGEDKSIGGVDVLSFSLLEGKSVLDNFFPNKTSIIVTVSLISILFGLAVYLLGSSLRIRRELYALSIIGGLTLYGIYVFYFFSSQLLYFYDQIMNFILTPNFLIGVVLFVLLLLSIAFYIGGYFIFLYEIVMEYHKRKWSGPIDEELVAAMRKIKTIRRNVIKPKKAQTSLDLFKYALAGFVSIVVLIAGYKMISVVMERTCNAEIAKFEIDLRDIDKSLRFGAKELQSHNAPCKVDRIYFFDLNKNLNLENFRDIPIMKDALEGGRDKNVFLVKEGDIKRSFYAGNLEIVYPYYICFLPKFDKISFFAEGAAKSAKIASACNQPECTLIPVDISEEEARSIINEAIEFACDKCPKNLKAEADKIKPTKHNVEIFRKFSVCDGITNVEIVIRPKKGAELKDFRFYELIPKTCIDDLERYLTQEIKGDGEFFIKSDPLIMWHFDDIGKEKVVSYELNTELDDECRQAIQGLGISQFIEGEEQQITINTPPRFTTLLPNRILRGVGLHQSVISNLWQYAEDDETRKQDLIFAIVDQTNPNLVDCAINVEKHIDCKAKRNKNGISTITVQVSDSQLTDRASFNVEIQEIQENQEQEDD